MWTRVCVRGAYSVTQPHSAHGVARPLNRILEEFLQRRTRLALQKKIIAVGRLIRIEMMLLVCIFMMFDLFAIFDRGFMLNLYDF